MSYDTQAIQLLISVWFYIQNKKERDSYEL